MVTINEKIGKYTEYNTSRELVLLLPAGVECWSSLTNSVKYMVAAFLSASVKDADNY